ncbi:MFS transporter [Myxococcota bacterium]|nr:MFS transporter [Myxococcota bacterium]
MSSENQAPSISRPVKLAYGLGQMGDAIVHFSFETLVFFYYTQVLGVSGTLAGLAVFVALVFDALSDPLIGSLSDSTRSRFGRRHPFMFSGPIPVSIFFYLLFVPPADLSQGALFAWLSGFSILARTSLTLFSVPHMSLGAELSQDYVGRTWIVATRMSFGAIGFLGASSVAFFGFFRPSEEFPVGHMNPEPYAQFAFSFALMIAAVQVLSSVGTLQTARGIQVMGEPMPFRPARVFSELRAAFGQKSFQWFAIGGVIAAGALGIRQTLVLHMNTFFWGLSSQETGIIMVMTLFALLIGYPFWASMSRRVEKRRVFQAGLWTLGICVAAPPALRAIGAFPDNESKLLLIPAVAFFSLLSALGGTGAQLAQGSMAADITDENALATGLRQEGVFFGSVNVLVKCSSGFGHQLAGIALDLIGLPASAQPGEVSDEIIADLGWIYGMSVLAITAMAAWAINRYRLDRKRVAEIQKILSDRSDSKSQFE